MAFQAKRTGGGWAVLLQAGMVAAIAWGGYLLFSTTQSNLAARNIASGFGFFSVEAGFPINNSLLPFSPADSYGYAFLIGVLNTLFVSSLGILFASILGVLVGMARVSGNWLVAKLAGGYVEVLRNVPLLLTLFFTYTVVLAGLPGPRASITPFSGWFLNNRGLYLPRPLFREGFGWVAAALLVALVAGVLLVLWALLPFLCFWWVGGGLGLKAVDQSQWGGLMLSTGLAVVGILLSIPLGILLALGRHSGPLGLRALCVGIIEPVRGVPLITILFMASVMLPLFLPAGMEVNNLLRVQAGMVLFSAAYMAEVVRGGLQAIPAGQYEAAASLGLGYWRTTLLVVLPQALAHVIPSLINRSIALFKDTSLVIIVGLLDFLGMIKASTQDPQWLGHEAEAYVFCAGVYWVICFSMSCYGRSLESDRKGG